MSTTREPEALEILSAACGGRLRAGDWGTVVLAPGGAHTGAPGRRIPAGRIGALLDGDTPLMVRVGALYALTDIGYTYLTASGDEPDYGRARR